MINVMKTIQMKYFLQQKIQKYIFIEQIVEIEMVNLKKMKQKLWLLYLMKDKLIKLNNLLL